MRSIFLTGLMFLASAVCVFSQTPDQNNSAQPTPTPTVQNSNGYVRPDAKKRFKWYVNGMFGPVALGKDVVSAGWATARNSPEEWGPHWEGFGKRFASSLGKGIIKNTVQYGLDETFKLDSHFYRSKDRSFKAKVSNALVSTVTARKTNGERTVGFPRIVGTYSASIIGAEAWYPKRFTWKDGLKNGTISLGFTAAFNLFKEFWKK